jgi:anthranilate phosphoribosyltransferase
VLAGQADPVQVGAFLMLLRYRGEDPDEISGLVEAAREAAGIEKNPIGAALDWPSYGAGRTRGAPWFLLSALALSRAGIAVLMHGSNEFSAGVSVLAGLAALGREPAQDLAEAERKLALEKFAYLPIEALSPEFSRLLGLRRLFGLRSPVNTVARLLDPGNASAGVDGVFHPPYIAVHLAAAERLGRPRLLVLKGGGGEAERNPAKPTMAHLWVAGSGCSTQEFPATPVAATAEEAASTGKVLAEVWGGEIAPPLAVATVCATIAMALLALGHVATPEAADGEAKLVWRDRASSLRQKP